MRTEIGVAGILGMTMALACGSSTTSNAATGSRSDTIQKLTGNAATGKTQYTSTCVSCHGADGKSGTAGVNATGEVKNDVADAIEQILKGGGGMSSYSSLSDQEIADILAHMRTL